VTFSRNFEWARARVADSASPATGKIQKEPLRQAGVTDRTWDRESVGYKIARRV